MTDAATLAAQLGGQEVPADSSALATSLGGSQLSDEAAGGGGVRSVFGMFPGGKYIPELALGAAQTVGALGQAVAHMGGDNQLTAPLISRLTGGMTPSQAADAANQKVLDLYNQYFGLSPPPGAGVAKGIGQAALLAPVLPAGVLPSGALGSAAEGGIAGGIGGALTPIYGPQAQSDFWAQKAKQAGQGGLIGAALGGALGAVGGAIKGPGSPTTDQQALLDAGVRLTPGQAAGGFLKSIEDKLTSFPIVGDLIRSRRFEGISDFQKAMYSKALAPFGDEGAQVVADAPIGNKGVAAVGDYLSSKYSQALDQSVPSPITSDFQTAVNQISSMVPRSKRADFADVINQQITQNLTPAGTLTPTAAKAADSALGNLYANYRGSQDGDQRLFANAIAQTQQELRNMVAQSNPQTAPMIQAANEGWRTLVQIENAANAAGARADGIFSPANFLAAIKKGDTSVRDRAFSRGEAWNQDFAQQAQRVLPSQVPDSGTPGRAIIGGALAAAAGHGLPITAAGVPYAVGVTGLASAPFLPGVSPLAARLIAAPRPESMVSLGQLVQGSAPYLAPVAVGATNP